MNQQSRWQQQRLYVEQNSVFYKALLQGRKLPESLTDLPVLPLTSKSDLRASQQSNPPFGNYISSPEPAIQRLHRTSGTTGQAMNLALSEKDANITATIGGRCQSLAGLTAQHRVVHCLNYQLWMGGLTDHLTLEKTGAMVIPFGVGNTDTLIRTIRELGIDAISCTPSYPAVLEALIGENYPSLDPSDLGLKLGLFGGEPGLDEPAFRQHLFDTWGMQARNSNYGVTDVMCNFASQCPDNPDLHFMAEDYLYAELINPESQQNLPLESGQRGELVLTHLERDCQPLVRFRTGDIIDITATDTCTCKSGSFRFRVIGRSDDMVVIRGINVFPTGLASVLAEFNEHCGEYRIVLDHPPPYDVLPVRLEIRHTLEESQQTYIEQIQRTIKQQLGVTAQITPLPQGSLPLTEGKTRRVLRPYQE